MSVYKMVSFVSNHIPGIILMELKPVNYYVTYLIQSSNKYLMIVKYVCIPHPQNKQDN